MTTGSRLTPFSQGIQAEDGSKAVTSIGWADNKLKTNCSFRDVGGGELRCLPTSIATAGTFYADSSCSNPLTLAYTAANPCSGIAPVPTYAEQPMGDAGCGGLQLFTVVAPHDNDLFEQVGDQCQRHAVTDKVYFDVTGPLDANTFVKGTSF